MTSRLVRLALQLVPGNWRDAVADDVDDAAATARRRPAWMAWQAARIGVRMRVALAFDSLRFDIAYALRSLERARGFTAAAVLIFALGIGVNVAVFTAVDRVLFRELPYERPEDIVVMREVDDGGRPFGSVPAAIVDAVRRQHRGVVDVSISGFTGPYSLRREPDDAPPVRLTKVTHNTLAVFGVDVVHGRDFTKEDTAGNARVALISFDAWQHRFGAAADVVGLRVFEQPEADPVEIVGVLPEDFIPASNFLNPLSDGLVLDLDPDTVASTGPTARTSAPYVRLRSDMPIETAQAELDVVVEVVRRDQPQPASTPRTRLRLDPLTSVLFDRYVDYLWLIVGAASLVLAVACANLGTLMLVRSRSREQLAATQIALGASSWRLVRAGLVESALLSFAGVAVSMAVLHWSNAALRAVLPPLFSSYATGIADARVVLFAVTTALVCALVAGVYPSWRATRIDVLPSLQGDASGSRRLFGGRALLVAEAALSVVLVAGAAMTVRSFVTLARTDLGFNPDALYTIWVSSPRAESSTEALAKADAGVRFQQSQLVRQSLRSVPGVVAVGAVDVNPLSGARMGPIGPGFRESSRWRVTPGFFEAMQMPILSGRGLLDTDGADGTSAGILSESGLRLVWPGLRADEAIGRALRFPGEPAVQIVGVVSDVRPTHAATPVPSLYLPLTSHELRRVEYVIRVAPGTTPFVTDIRSRIRQAGVPVTTVTVSSVSQSLRSGLADQRFRAALFSVFGLAALLLAGLGLYAVGAYEVTRRKREVGIRLAIGGSTRTVQLLIMRQMLTPVVGGLVLGLAATYWVASLVQAFLHQVDARDLATLTIVGVVLLASTALAAWLPVRLAARLDPAAILREQ